MFDNKIYRFAAKDLIKVAEATQMAIASQRKKSELAIKAATDFLVFREYVCGQSNMPHMLEWHRALNTGESNGNLINIAGDDISILSPRGSSKSTWLCQWLSWVIGTHASAGVALKIAYISYVVSLAVSKSRQIKAIIESPLYRDVFPMVQPGSKWTEGEWQIDLDVLGLRTIDEPYTLVCAGLSGSIVGKRCVVGDTIVATDIGNLPIKDLKPYVGKIKILALNHDAKTLEYRKLEAYAISPAKNRLLEISTSSGNIIRCTDDHPIYTVEKGYKNAGDLLQGETVVILAKSKGNIQRLPRVSSGNIKCEKQKPYLQKVLSECKKSQIYNTMRLLWQSLQIASIQFEQVYTSQQWSSVLQQKMFAISQIRINEKAKILHQMQYSGIRIKSRLFREVLQGLFKTSKKYHKVSRNKLSKLWDFIFTRTQSKEVLHKGLSKQSAFNENEKHWQQSLQAWEKLQQIIREFASIDTRKGFNNLCDLWTKRSLFSKEKARQVASMLKFDNTPHRRKSHEQSTREFNNTLLQVSLQASCSTQEWTTDTISSITEYCNDKELVYDIQVEGLHNFFANGICTSNCHLVIFDDLIKQKSDATSRPIQEKMIDNYNNGIKFIRFPESRAINLGTRFAKHDIYNKIFVAPYYKILHQSALLTDENGQEYSYWEPDNINSTFGYPLALLQKERATDYESFLLQRQNLIPQDDVDGITKEHIKHGFLPSRFERIIIGGDLAGSVEKYSDATALCVIGINNEYIYVCDAWEEKLKGNWDKAKRIYEFWEKWQSRCKNKVILALDANKYSSLLKQDLEQWLDNPKLFKLENENFNDEFCNIFIEDVASAGRGKEKMDRMNSHSALFQNGRIIFNNIKEEMPNNVIPLDKMINEIIDHDPNESNDLMDSLEVAIYKGREFINSRLSVAN